MIVKTQFTDATGHLTLQVLGAFRFSDHRAFVASYSTAPKTPRSVTLDLSDTSEVDSAALGMMLLLADFVGGPQHVDVVGAKGSVARILEVAHLDHYFGMPEKTTAA